MIKKGQEAWKVEWSVGEVEVEPSFIEGIEQEILEEINTEARVAR